MASKPFMQNDLKGVTHEEISKLSKAMKDEKFREHMDEYVREISDPAHKAEYLQYLQQLEAKGEMPEGQQLLRAKPGCCAKTQIRFKNGQTQKCFINIVHSDQLDDLSFKPAEKGEGRNVNLPYSLSPPRPDRDSKDEYCMTCDFAVSSYTFAQATQNPQILKMLVDTACEGLSTRFLQGHEEVKKDFKLMQRMPCKGGTPMPMSVQSSLLKNKGPAQPAAPKGPMKDAVTPSELKEMRKEAKEKRAAREREEEQQEEEEEEVATKPVQLKEEDFAGRIRVPKHRLIHVGSIDLTDFMENKNQPTALTTVPKSLRLVVELPTVKTASKVSLEVTSYNVVVEVEGKFYLDLPLSYEIRDDQGNAKFDKAKQELTLELPVVPKPPIFNPAARVAEEGAVQDDNDGGISEGRGSEDELEELEEPPVPEKAEKLSDDPQAAEAEDDAEAAVPAAEAAAADEPPRRQRLEFDSKASSLQIAQPAEQQDEEPALGTEDVEEVDDAEAAGTSLEPFIPATSFEGARPLYYFGTGEQGLGYYRDSRQSAVKPRSVQREVRLTRDTAQQEGPGRPAQPLVMEVAQRAPEPEPQRPPLPPALRAYVDTTRALTQRVEAKDAQGDLPMEWQQTRQNVMLHIDLPRGHEVADVTLSLKAARLTIAFCIRAGTDAPWMRRRLCRILGGAADARQWHAELTPAAGETAGPQLTIVLRKADRATGTAPWPQIVSEAVPQPLIAEAAPAPEAVAPASAAPVAAPGEAAVPSASAPAASGEAAPLGAPQALGPLGTSQPVQEASLEDLDSGELDAAPADEPQKVAAATVAPLAAATAAALAQSAAVMGQSVLLHNRLMYQLL